MLAITVSDTGAGINPDDQQRLFTAFEQVKNADAGRAGGTGLGLSISRELAHLLGGRLTIDSALGEGSTFTLELPVSASTTVEAGVAGEAAPQALAGSSILLVTSAPALRDHVSQQLQHFGATVTIADDAGAAHLAGSAFTAVVGDARDPAVLQYLDVARADAPVVALINPGQRIAAASAGLGQARTITLPARPEHVLEAISAAVAGSVAQAATPVRQIPAARHRSAGASPELGQLRVLVADDDDVNQKIAHAMLLKLGHQADLVSNGQEAIDAMQLARYDVVLMDCQMPGVDGWEATRRLRRDPRTSEVPIIALTASASTDVRDSCLQAGMNDYLVKPISTDELREALSRAVQTVS